MEGSQARDRKVRAQVLTELKKPSSGRHAARWRRIYQLKARLDSPRPRTTEAAATEYAWLLDVERCTATVLLEERVRKSLNLLDLLEG